MSLRAILFFFISKVFTVYTFPNTSAVTTNDETSSTKSEEHHKNTPRLKRVSELNYAHANNKNNDTRHKQPNLFVTTTSILSLELVSKKKSIHNHISP